MFPYTKAALKEEARRASVHICWCFLGDLGGFYFLIYWICFWYNSHLVVYTIIVYYSIVYYSIVYWGDLVYTIIAIYWDSSTTCYQQTT